MYKRTRKRIKKALKKAFKDNVIYLPKDSLLMKMFKDKNINDMTKTYFYEYVDDYVIERK